MTNPMIERVAKEIQAAAGEKPATCEHGCYSSDWTDYIAEAKAAIAAMREPTAEMIKAGDESDYSTIEGCSIVYLMDGDEDGLAKVYRAMIDHALKEE